MVINPLNKSLLLTCGLKYAWKYPWRSEGGGKDDWWCMSLSGGRWGEGGGERGEIYCSYLM
jgi:hypothetical protein